jgi:ABC-2 type transport system permease protein
VSGARTIARLIYRQQRRGAIAWGSVFGLFVWVSAYGYASAYPTAKDRASIMKTLGSNKGIRALFGPARALDTVNGFTAWRCAMLFATIGAVWGLLLATKVARGEEDEGRAELLFAGPVTRRSGLIGQLLGLAATVGVLFVTVAAWFVSVGVLGDYFSVTAALWFAVVACAGAALFVAVGAMTAQLASSRRVAAAVAGAALGTSFVVRAIAESVDGAHWLAWASPFGWVDKAIPLTGTNAPPMLPVIAVVAACLAATLALAARRDLGAGIWSARDVAEPKVALLRSPVLLGVRLTRGVAIGWMLGIAMFAAVFGVVSTAVSDSFGDNKSVSDMFARLGAEISAKGYVGLTFIMLGALLGFTAATFLGSCREEESTGRLELLSAGPLRRGRWFTGRMAVAAAWICVLGFTAGIGGWLGVAVSGGSISFGEMLFAGLNTVPPGLLVLGLGAAAYGFAPRSGVAVAYAIVAWSFLIEMVGALVNLNHFVLDTSVIHHLAAAPAVDPRWSGAVAMIGVGLVCAVVGAVALQRRDIAQG